VDHAQHCADWELATDLQPRVELFPRPAVHPDFTALAALSSADEHGAAVSVEVALLERERFADSQAGAPEQDDERAESVAVGAVADCAHDRDDLFNRRRVGRICSPLLRGGRPWW
jgi:hypothetical protein